MNIPDLRLKYKKNELKIKKLELLRDNSNKEDLDKLKREQNELSKSIRQSLYKNVSKSDIKNIKEKQKLNINKNNEIVVNKEKVVINSSEEIKDEPIKVINITGEEDSKDDDVTEKLVRETIPLSKICDAKVVFDGSYKIIYDDGNGIYEEGINNLLLEHDIEEDKNVYNFSIIKLLKDFDQQNNTNLYRKYMSNDIPVEYNFNKVDKKSDSIRIKKIKRIAKKEAKAFKNVSIKDNRKMRFKAGLACAATATLLLIGGLGLKNHKNKTIVSDVTTTIETVQELDTIKEVNSIKNVSKEKPSSLKEIDKSSVSIIDTEDEQESLRIGDSITLNSTDLYNASTDDLPNGNTKYIEGNYSYKASIISVVYKNQVMNLCYNDSINIKELENISKEKYGEDVKISINFDLVDENGNVVIEHVGWVDSKDINSKGKVLIK